MNAAGMTLVDFEDDVLVTFGGYGDTAAFYSVAFSVIGNENMNQQIELFVFSINLAVRLHKE